MMKMGFIRRHRAVTCCLALLALPVSAIADTVFAVVGDVPYGEQALQRFPELVTSMEQASPDFAIHVGDIKGGSAPCTNEMLSARIKAIDEIKLPVIYIPGDNDWTDCHRRRAGRFLPQERLQFLRRIAYPELGQSLGSPTLALESQASQSRWTEFPEHAYWKSGTTSFLTLHVLGSDNGLSQFKSRVEADDDEVKRRIEATLHWLEYGFEQAEGSDALVIAIHGNPFGMSERRARKYPIRPYADFLASLKNGAAAFNKPVLLIHGDTHDYKFDQPIEDSNDETISNLFRLEGIGSPDIGWVKVSIQPNSPEPFEVEPVFIAR